MQHLQIAHLLGWKVVTSMSQDLHFWGNAADCKPSIHRLPSQQDSPHRQIPMWARHLRKTERLAVRCNALLGGLYGLQPTPIAQPPPPYIFAYSDALLKCNKFQMTSSVIGKSVIV